MQINKNPDNELIAAYMMGNFDLFSHLIDEGENVNCLDTENNSLISVVIQNPKKLKNNKKFFNKLISNGVSLEQIGWEQGLLTMCAIHQKDTYYAKKLLKCNMNINSIGVCRIDSGVRDEILCIPFGPPLLDSVISGNLEHFDFFIENNPDLNIIDSQGNPILNYLFIRCHGVPSQKGREYIFEKLLDNKININHRDENGDDILGCLTNCDYGDAYDNLVKILLKKAKNINIDTLNKFGKTPLINSISALNELTETTKILIRNKANLDIFDISGKNALMKCLKHDNFKSFEFLVKKGANLLSINKNGDTVIHYIANETNKFFCDEHHKKYYNIILSKHPELMFQKNNSGLSPLDILKQKDLYKNDRKKFLDPFIKKIKTNGKIKPKDLSRGV